VAIEARKSSYDEAVESISQTTGGYILKRQSLNLAQDVAQDFDDFHLQNRYLTREKTDNLLVLTFDGKGIVMRPEGLRKCTKKAVLKSKKLNSRLSAEEKKIENAWYKWPLYTLHYLIFERLKLLRRVKLKKVMFITSTSQSAISGCGPVLKIRQRKLLKPVF
jgi:hypothetical protein